MIVLHKNPNKTGLIKVRCGSSCIYQLREIEGEMYRSMSVAVMCICVCVSVITPETMSDSTCRNSRVTDNSNIST